MRILSLTTSYPRHSGDYAGRFVWDLHAALREEGCTVTTLCPGTAGAAESREDEAGRVVRLSYGAASRQRLFYEPSFEGRGMGPLPTLFAGAGFLRTLRRAAEALADDHDGILVHWPWPLLLSLPRRARRLPAVGVTHGADLRWLRRSSSARWLFRRSAPSLRGLLIPRRDWAPWLSGLAGSPAVPTPMGTDPARAGGPGVACNGRLLGVGRLVREKGFDRLIEAAARLDRAVDVIGEGPQRPALERTARTLGARVVFQGACALPAVWRALRAARVLVVPSLLESEGGGEGFPAVICEAAVAGTPVVASPAGGISGWLPWDRLAAGSSVDALEAGLRRELARERRPFAEDATPFLRSTAAGHALELLSRESGRAAGSPPVRAGPAPS